MNIKNTSVDDFGGFELDLSSIKMTSANRSWIVLPYYGALPPRVTSGVPVYIRFNIQLKSGAAAVLVSDPNNRRAIAPLDITNDEVKHILDSFFNAEHSDSEFDPYYLGLWRAHYEDWRSVVDSPSVLWRTIQSISHEKLPLLQQCVDWMLAQ